MPLTPATALISVLDSTLLVAGSTTLTVGGKVYTFVSGVPVGDQIQIGATDPLTAANIAIRVSTDTATTLCLASAALDRVTLTANTPGTAGNSILLSTTAVAGALTVTSFAGGSDFSLIVKEDVKQYLDQIEWDTSKDELLDTICLRVEDIVEDYLGFTFDDYTNATTKTVYGSGTPWLNLPPHEAGSITSFVYEGGTSEITGWTEEEDGNLYLIGAVPWGGGWTRSARYVVTANWGYGSWPPALKEVATELCVNIFRERDKGAFSDVIGVEGDGAIAVGYARAWTNRQKAILDMVRRQYQQVAFV